MSGWPMSSAALPGLTEPPYWMRTFAAASGGTTMLVDFVLPGPDGSLWMLTNNTDGRGSPNEGDDRILQVRLAPLVEG